MCARHAFALATAIAVCLAAAKAPETPVFDIKDPKGVNTLTFWLDGNLEPFAGLVSDVRGKVTFDPKNIAATSGQVNVGLKSMTMANSVMADNAKGAWCLDCEHFPDAIFKIKRVENVIEEGKGFKAQVTGDFSIKGVTKEIVLPVRATYFPDGQKLRMGGDHPGDILVIRSEFHFSRSEFNIGKALGNDLIGDDVTVKLQVAATYAKKA